MKKEKRTLSKSAERQLMYAKVYGEEMKHDYYYYEDDISDKLIVYGIIVC
jgi:hypothetical protein